MAGPCPVSGPSLHQAKHALRQRFRAKRDAIAVDDAAHASRRMCERLLALLHTLGPPRQKRPSVSGHSSVSGYWPVRGEIDCRPALRVLDSEGYPCLLPVIDRADAPLLFRRWQKTTVMEKGMFAIPIPPLSMASATPDIVLLPLLAFNRRGQRLGYGGGFYDRTLADLRRKKPHLRALGLAFSVQENPDIATDHHDQNLNIVVTEKEIIHIPSTTP